MEIRAAVVDVLPLFRHGAVSALHDAGHRVDEPPDVWAWLSDAHRHIVIVGLGTAFDWQLLTDLHAARPDVSLLALVNDSAPETYVRALAAGAVAVAPRAGSADSLREAFDQLVNGRSVLPVAVISCLVGGRSGEAGMSGVGDQPSTREREWLRHLAAGHTVAQLARTAGYSERMMYRLLRSLYARMDVSNRTEALMYARDNYWI